MRILIVHNYYQQNGGEDVVFEAETEMLRAKGHEVFTYTASNQDLPSSQVKLATNSFWSFEEKGNIRQLLREHKPDVVHFHNTFMKISPAAYYACKEEHIPIVQSLHNPRIICPAASLRRDGEVCELCVGKTFAWPSIVHSCYRNSKPATAVVAGMLAFHRVLGTWSSLIDQYIVFTDFYRHKFIESGTFRPEKLAVKPHFIAPDPLERTVEAPGDYAVFIGRLDPEKGVQTFLDAWEEMPHITLKIRGGGQMLDVVQKFISEHPSHKVEIIDRLSREELITLIKSARCLIWSSEGYYETFGLVAAEALACGVPVIASKTGVMEEIITDGLSGLHFEPGNAADLREKVLYLWDNPDEAIKLGHSARCEFEKRFSEEDNYRKLIGIYESVVS